MKTPEIICGMPNIKMKSYKQFLTIAFESLNFSTLRSGRANGSVVFCLAHIYTALRHNKSNYIINKGGKMDIYVKPIKKVSVSEASHITLGHICEVQAPAEIKERVERLKLVETDAGIKRRMYLISVIDIIKAIDQSFPGHTINNVGETETVVSYNGREQKDRPLLKWLKISVISVIFAVGAATAIMSFHNDAEIPKVFSAYYKMFTGRESDAPRVIQISYSIGIALGIIVFFNHFCGKRITKDPSPIEVEMSEYEKIVTDTQADFLAAKKGNGGGNKNDPVP